MRYITLIYIGPHADRMNRSALPLIRISSPPSLVILSENSSFSSRFFSTSIGDFQNFCIAFFNFSALLAPIHYLIIRSSSVTFFFFQFYFDFYNVESDRIFLLRFFHPWKYTNRFLKCFQFCILLYSSSIALILFFFFS